jgi:Na+/H+ antiporter NhaD/arsenite permease-like protein
MGILFLIGYLLITLEGKIDINKGAIALVLSSVLWTLYVIAAPQIVPIANATGLANYLAENPILGKETAAKQAVDYVIDNQLLEHVGDVGEIVFFLLGAMTVVEMIDSHNGFALITNFIKTRSKRKLLWLVAVLAFFLSAVIDNMTTAIVMTALMCKLIPDKKERWWFSAIIILASNSGGAWSPIGDVTTILLWVKGTVTPMPLIKYILLPSIVSVLIPLLWVSTKLKGEIAYNNVEKTEGLTHEEQLAYRNRLLILIVGVCGLLAVPVFKTITHLPPYAGVMLVVGILWILTDRLYRHVGHDIPLRLRLESVLKRVDYATLLFFLGILLSVAALQAAGALATVSAWLERTCSDVYVINLTLGVMSAVVDNVPLVAAALGLYPLVDPKTVAISADPTFMANFVPDGVYWHFLTYCAGVGGSLLIIGSAAGVVVMGMEKMSFSWYLKNISLMALAGYIAGALVYMAEVALF